MEPVNYRIRLEPDLKSFVFKGMVDITLKTEEPIEQISLDANDLVLESSKVQMDKGHLVCPFSSDTERQEVTVKLPEKMDGTILLTIDYWGNINDQYAGLYRSRYEHDGQEKYFATTQFEASDARRAFPCLDHPARKATFDIELLIDERLTGIANTQVSKEEILENGKKLLRFERTPKMSTYLVFFGVGEFEFIEDGSERPLVRVATAPGRTQYADFALQMARKTLKFCQEYTGIDYPLSKCDYIAVPDSFGAMENYGAIRHSEDALLVYPGATSKPRRALIAKIIAHEGSHMWFGDLVGPADWKYVWLNEAFATYFTYWIPDRCYPQWQVWDQFFAERMLPAMERDSLLETVPIELPDDQVPDAELGPTPSTAPIIYSKGAAVIRMLTAYLGQAKVRKGINHFLNLYKFECATSQQYWTAFEEATDEPVGKFADSWVYQAGYPIVEARTAGSSLVLTQQRFTFSPVASDKTWVIPLDTLFFLGNGETKCVSTLLEEKTTAIPMPRDTVAFKVNSCQTSFCRVEYEQEMLYRLGHLIKEKRLSAADSFGVQNDLFALVRRGSCSVADYIVFVKDYFDQEDRYVPLLDIAENLMTLYLVARAWRERIGDVGRGIFERSLEIIGLEPRDDDSLQVSDIRGTLLWIAATLGSAMAVEFGTAKFQDLLDRKGVHADILPSVLKIGATTNEHAPAFLMRKAMSADTPETERILALTALGCLRDKEELLAALDANSKVPKSNRAHMINAAAKNSAATSFMWQWFLGNVEQLEQLPLSQLARVISILIPVCGVGKETDVEDFFVGFVKRHKALQDTVKMTMEILEIHSRLGNAR